MSSVLTCEVSAEAEVLIASFLLDVEFCANTELTDAKITNVRVITRNFFCSIGFLSCRAKLSWA
jgi:hypothetical protein